MDSKLNIAKDCFVEDVEMFADPETDAEKFNLYNGLANLVEGLLEVKMEIYKIHKAGLIEGVAEFKKEVHMLRKAGLVEGVADLQKELRKIRQELQATRVSIRDELQQMRKLLDKVRR